MEATALASTLGVSEGEYAAFAEYVKAVSEKLGTRALSTQHVRAWRTDLAACPARASVLTFAQEVSTRIDEAAAASARVRQSIFASLMFTCIYGKNAHGERLQFEVALQRVLDQVVERASAEPPTQPLQYVPGKYGAAHAAVRAAAYPYTPACASDINHTTVDCIDANGGLLGYVCVDEDFGYLDDLCVLPRAQGYGIAACLVVQAAKSLVERRVDTISLHVRAANLPARRLYSALGFAEGDNEYPSWYDWHGGFHLEAESALVAAHSRGGSLNSGATAPARPLAMVASATALPAFVSLFATEAAAYRASRSQTGASNCGATAVATALDAIGVPTRAGAKDVTVRSRDYATLSLLKYLRSRSNAGCTAADLVEGAGSVSGGGAVAHFFPTGPLPPHGLCGWLAEWLALGAAPIATINTQLDGADYWHHQAVIASPSASPSPPPPLLLSALLFFSAASHLSPSLSLSCSGVGGQAARCQDPPRQSRRGGGRGGARAAAWLRIDDADQTT